MKNETEKKEFRGMDRLLDSWMGIFYLPAYNRPIHLEFTPLTDGFCIHKKVLDGMLWSVVKSWGSWRPITGSFDAV